LKCSSRSYGSGHLYVRRDAGGGEAWYGQWRIGAKKYKRKLGSKRKPGTREG